jgi:4-amino-4-deoxy-L-arabinose transferase-like glycosyltransferase
MRNFLRPRRPFTRHEIAALLGLLAYGTALWIYRPASPFEWDEVLFLRGLHHYDVANHAPHPPGYPLYMALGKLFELVVGNPVVALQLLSIVTAMATLVLLWLLARSLGAPRRAATTAAVLLAVSPAFAFNANVGLSDVPGTAGALAAAWLLLRAWDSPERLPWGATGAALAAGIRPQVVVILLPLAVVAVVRAARQARWRPVLRSVAAGLAASVACWLPAILLTGPRRYWLAVTSQAEWMTNQEQGGRFPGAPLHELFQHWLLVPFGNPILAAFFWLALAVGAWLLWQHGMRRLLAVAAGAGGCYLFAAFWTLHMGTSVRYILPALAFLCLLPGGLALPETPRWRRPFPFLLATWCLAAAVLIAGPAFDVRRRRPAPVWEALEWIVAHRDPATTTVVFDRAIEPHALYVLGLKKFRIVELKSREERLPQPKAGRELLFVGPEPFPTGEVLFASRWHVPQLAVLTRQRYESCAVSLIQGPGGGRAPAAGVLGHPAPLSTAPPRRPPPPRTAPPARRNPAQTR